MKWRILGKIKSQEPQARQEEIVKILYQNRGLKTKSQQNGFLRPKNPFRLNPKEAGLSSREIQKAVTRIRKAVEKKEKIVVYGDYDADGICATAILWEALDRLGAKAMPYLPSRDEGYGLKVARIDQMKKEGVKLIITVDQGIVHSRQVAHAQRKGIDVIVTDHHLPGKKKPRALAIIHSVQISGAGAAWFLARELGGRPDLELVTIGTITDMVSLTGVSRSLVKFGLKKLGRTKRPGLKALYDFAALAKEKIRPYEVGFAIGPRLNAAGRMDDPMESLRLICTRDENRAISLAQKIDQKNRERQELMKKATNQARNLWLEEDGQSALIFVYHQSFEHGIIGLVASRLKEEFSRPAVVLAPRQDHWVGSARSIDDFSIIQAIREFKDILGDHGGHRLAAGFSVREEKIETLKDGLLRKADQSLSFSGLIPKIEIEAEVNLPDLNYQLYQQIEKLAPFGMGNLRPIFAVRRVKVINSRTVGKENQHLKFQAVDENSGVCLEAIGFSLGDYYPRLSPEKPVDMAFNLSLNEWNGRKNIQLKLKDIKMSQKKSGVFPD